MGTEAMSRLGASILLVLWLPAAALAGELDEAQRRGREIYLRGISPAGADVVALIGDARTEVPASVLPCGGCHGPGGHGRARGELAPADLTWPALSAPLAAGADGRRRPPYDEALLKRAITRGLDAGGGALHVAMPRYRLTSRDAADLIAYLRTLGADPAVTARDSRPGG